MRRGRAIGAVGAALLFVIGQAPPASPAPTAALAQRSIATIQLPRGGRIILGHYRVVAYYGVPGTSALGVLGSGTPEHAAQAIARKAAAFKPYGKTIQPAMEIIATVAQASAGADGDYSAPVSLAAIKRYLAAAHRHKMLVILDLQPGRASFLSQVRKLHDLLLDPAVSIALDPEWKVGPHQRPGGGLIGSSSAAGVNAVIDYLSILVGHHKLPDKLCVVHEFTRSMLPDRSKIRPAKGVEVAFHADGFGSPTAKRRVYNQLAFPGRPFGAGFKLFLRQDSRVMTPAEVMRLRPQPDIVTYQ